MKKACFSIIVIFFLKGISINGNEVKQQRENFNHLSR